jgi:retinoid hydroxylase
MRSLHDIPLVELPLRAAGSGILPSFLAGAAVEHGPVIRAIIPAGRETGREVVFLIGPEANRLVLHTHRDHFSHDQGWSPVIGAAVGHGLLNMDDPMHAHHRKLWNPAFTGARIDAYLPAMQRVIVERTSRWAELGEVDLYEESRWLTFDIAATVLAGLQTGPPLDRARDLFYLLFHGYDRRRESRQSFQRRKAIARKELDDLLLAMIAGRRGIPPEEQPRDVLGMIVHARDEHGATLSDSQILAHLNILLVAGHETTTTFSTWALYLLATLPEHRERIRAELKTLPDAGNGPLTPGALQALPWLDCFFREVSRLYAPVLHLPRGVLKPVLFSDVVIPPGVATRLAIAAGHRLPHVFTEPEWFDPGRFVPPREEDKRRPYGLVPFGAGSRVCIGINFSQIEVKALIAHVLRHYDLEPLPDQRPIHAGFWVARIPFGIRARVVSRAPASSEHVAPCRDLAPHVET